MQRHKESHMDHGFTEAQWSFIFRKYEGRDAFFIDTLELPEELGTVTTELYGPSAGDAPVTEDEVVYETRGDRAWKSRMVDRPRRPTRFVRVIAGPHEEKCERCNGTGVGPYSDMLQGGWPMPGGMSCVQCVGGGVKHACILYTAYGVSSLDMAQSPKEPGDLEARMWSRPMMESLVHWYRDLLDLKADDARQNYAMKKIEEWNALEVAHGEADAFWRTHALAK